jgi:hypothetical protein
MSEQNKIKYTTQAMNNMSFDEELKVNMVEIIGQDGVLKNPATEETLQEIVGNDYPAGAGSNGTITLTNATTAYSVPATASTKNHTLIIYNGSDTDMYVGYATLTTGGILLPSGGVMTFDLGANQTIFAYCGSAGKVINYSYKEIN